MMRHASAWTCARNAVRQSVVAIACVVASFAAAPSLADSVTLLRSRVALKGCEIQAIQNAQVFYIDPAGNRQKRAVDEVWTISFDALPVLDEAEKAFADRDYETARRRLLEALMASNEPMHQLWLRHRLLRVHDVRNEFAEACACFAEIVVLDPDPSWARRVPRCEPAPTTYAAAKEAMDALARADRVVKVQAIQHVIDDLAAKLRPIFAELEKHYSGPPIAAGSTISGVLKSDIGKWTEPSAAPPTDSESAPDVAPPSSEKPAAAAANPTPAPAAQAPPSPDSPQAIDLLLREQRYGEALALCERIAAHFDQRDIPQFLYQYAEALRLSGKPRDAAVMYMRAAVLYPASPQAGPALIATALLYRDTFARPETARRLLERVVSDAERAERPDLAERARTLLRELPTSQR